MTDSLVPVAVACPCPGTPHDGDTVYLAPKLSLHGGMVAQNIIVNNIGQSPALAADLTICYLEDGVRAWSFQDEQGDVALSPESLKSWLLSDFTLATPVANKADELYSPAVIDPLVAAVSKSSNSTRTRGSTSARNGSSGKRPKPSKRSSIITIQTADTEPTSV